MNEPSDAEAPAAAAPTPTAAGPAAMAGRPHRWLPLVLTLAVGGGVLPPVLYAWVFGRHAIAPRAAKELLTGADPRAVLVDIRTAEEYAASHIRTAVNWPRARIAALTSLDGLPPGLKGKRLVLTCQSGGLTVCAVRKLRGLGLGDTVSIRGGVQDWIADARRPAGGALDDFVVNGKVVGPPARDASAFEQWVAVIAGFGVKTAYGLLSFALILVLWRRKSADLAALRWAMICFFLGEQACALNWLLFDEQSYTMEYLHSFGMALCFAFTTYAVFEGMDRRMIRFSDLAARCAAMPLCLRCYKHLDVPCGLKRTFLLVIPAMALLAFMPLTAAPTSESYNVRVFGTFYNYSHPAAYQLYETVCCPLLAIALLVGSLAVLIFRKAEPVALSKVLFAAGMGPLGFALLRLFIRTPYDGRLVWFTFWEETTELLFIAGVAYVLWVFRRGLWAKDNP